MNNNLGSTFDEAKIFWGEMAPCEHIAQFYADDAILQDTLTGFVHGGLIGGECAIIIATPPHLSALNRRLADAGVDLRQFVSEDRLITMTADAGLASFMVKDWPDDDLFTAFVESLIRRASHNDRRVRAFGEMVALLWARGLAAATVHLEHLWHQFCLSHSFSLLCAYPKAGFTEDPKKSLDEICAAHSRIV